ncbi:MAG: SRPBCC domain-containing protein [Terricaulis sp.]
MLAPLAVDLPNDREIVVTRGFNAPRHLVFEAFSKAELVKRWLLGPPGWSMPFCAIDMRVGGAYRYEWRHIDGRTMGMGGVFREVEAPVRWVATEVFDDAWYPGQALVATVLSEEGRGRTLSHAHDHLRVQGSA